MVINLKARNFPFGRSTNPYAHSGWITNPAEQEICDFAKLWWKKNQKTIILTTEAESEIKEISEKLAQKFEKWLKNQSL